MSVCTCASDLLPEAEGYSRKKHPLKPIYARKILTLGSHGDEDALS